MKHIVIDPGHGGPDPGAIGVYGLREADVNLSVALRVSELLPALSYAPLRVTITHQGDGAPLQNRVHLANEVGADLFVSIHCNGHENPFAHGYEVWTYRGSPNLADYVAGSVYANFRRQFPEMRSREDWSDGDPDKETRRLAVLKWTNMPALLIELGFVTNGDDARILRNPDCQDRMAQAIAEAVHDAL